MTIEQAIKVLEESYTVAYHDNDGTDETAKELCSALPLALSALREQQERMQGCEYCKGKHFSDRQTFPMSDYENSVEYEIGIDTDNALYATPLQGCTGDSIETLPINYCPMCGRKLGESNG